MKMANGYGSIYKMKGKRRKPYRVRVSILKGDGIKPIRKSLGCYETQSMAYQALAEYHNDPTLILNKKVTFVEVYNMWWKTKERQISDSAKRSYDVAIKSCQTLHSLPFSEVRLVNLQQIIDKLGNKYFAKKKMKTLFNQMYDYAIANDICTRKYSEYINIGMAPKSDIHKPFTKKEKELLWKSVNKIPYVDVILRYIYTGFRPTELLEIKKENGVNLKEKYLKGGMKTEAGKDRIVPIHPKIYPLIEKWYYKDGKYLITNSHDCKMSYDNWSDIFAKTINKIGGIDKTHKPHDPRHTLASDLDTVGANKISIQRILGHASKTITDKVYTHKDIEELRKSIELLP